MFGYTFIKYATFASPMKPLTLEAYKLLFYLTGSKVFAYYVAVALVSVLNVIVLMGLSLLLEGIFPTAALARFFSFPFNIGAWLVLFLINLRVAPLSFMDVASHIHVRYIKLLLYAGIAALILAYKMLLNIA